MLFSGASQSASQDLAAKSIKYKYPDDWGAYEAVHQLFWECLRAMQSHHIWSYRSKVNWTRVCWSSEHISHLYVCVIIKQEQLFFFFFVKNGAFKGESHTHTKKPFLVFRQHNMSDLFHFNTNVHSHFCKSGLWRSWENLINPCFVCEWQQTAEESPHRFVQ